MLTTTLKKSMKKIPFYKIKSMTFQNTLKKIVMTKILLIISKNYLTFQQIMNKKI